MSETETKYLNHKKNNIKQTKQTNKSILQHDLYDFNWKPFIVAAIANALEFYDLSLIAFFSDEIGYAFFGHGSDSLHTIEVFALFGVAYLMRPFGGALFGYISDVYGRRISFRISIILMGVCTILTGCLPTYNQIGIGAPILLCILRIFQGLSTGGEVAASIVYIYEISPKNRQGLLLAIKEIFSFGFLLATICNILINAIFTDEQLNAYGWRIPFWFGVILIILVFLSNEYMEVTDTFDELQTNNDITHSPIMDTLKYDNFNIFIFVIASSFFHGSMYISTTFYPDYIGNIRGSYNDKYAYIFNAINYLIAGSLPMLAVGYYVDKIGYNIFMSVGLILSLILSPILWYLTATLNSMVMDFISQFIILLVGSLLRGSMSVFYFNTLLIDARNRTTMYGIAYNIGAAIFSGTADFIGAALISEYGIITGAILTGFWMSTMASLSLIGYMYVIYCKNTTSNVQYSKIELQFYEDE